MEKEFDLQKIVSDLATRYRKVQENMIVCSILDIYDNPKDTYEEYLEKLKIYNDSVRDFNNRPVNSLYICERQVEMPVLDKDVYNYIVSRSNGR